MRRDETSEAHLHITARLLCAHLSQLADLGSVVVPHAAATVLGSVRLHHRRHGDYVLYLCAD